jgi:hypothetical protein
MNLLIHGAYDKETVHTLYELGVQKLAFDLRGRSSNLIPYRDLITILKEVKGKDVFLSFENDRDSTVLSFLNLLQKEPFNFILFFRDQQSPDFYYKINHSFYWMFHPAADWKAILTLPTLKGIVLPLVYEDFYQQSSELWSIIDHRNLEVYLHASSFQEAEFLKDKKDINLSLDLTREVEKGFRKINQDFLKQQKIWRHQ